jgi:TrmH family RNA methyltransferase
LGYSGQFKKKEMINSRHNLWIKHLIKLKEDKKYRSEQQLVVISGVKLVTELSVAIGLKTLILLEGAALPQGVVCERVQYVTRDLLKQITGLQHPEPMAAEVRAPCAKDVEVAPRLLVLDGVSDPGNLGTLLRTALALGWEGVFMTSGCVDLCNDKALRASKGAPFFLSFQVGSYEDLNILLKKRGGVCFVADARGKSDYCIEGKERVALILGNESHGVSECLKCHFESVAIPLDARMESLNVAIAGAILMHQMRRLS